MKCLILCVCCLMLSACAVYKDREGQTHYELLPPPPAVYYAPPPAVYYEPPPPAVYYAPPPPPPAYYNYSYPGYYHYPRGYRYWR